MENQETAALLIQDLESNILFLQVGAFAMTIVLALIGLTLAMRAYTVLSEARGLYWKAGGADVSVMNRDANRAVRAAAIRTAQSSKKKSNARPVVI